MTTTNAAQSAAHQPTYRRAKKAAEHLQIATSTLWCWAATREDFPRPIKAGPRVTLFDIGAIENYLRAQA